MNVHLLSPQTSPICFERHFPKMKRATPALRELDAILDKPRPREKYV
jgi:hypothetical protein